MRWLIGLDLTERSRGALQLAGWLHAASQSPAAQASVAVHVLDERLRRMLRTDQRMELVARAERELNELVDDAAAGPGVTGRKIVEADAPERGITDALERESCDGLIVGRAAERSGGQLVRLGRVARRLLRQLPKPTIVVPPDMSLAALGKGPLLVATDLGPASVPAIAFASRLASEIGREIVAVHVDPGFEYLPTFWGDPIVVPGLPRRVPTDVDVWTQSVGLSGVRTRLAEGNLVENVLDIAKIEDAPIIVCGSRKLDALDRIFVSSTSVDLARLADRPVLVVPSH